MSLPVNDMASRLFGLGGIRGVIGTFPVTLEDIELIGRSISIYIDDFKKGSIIIAQDTRESSDELFHSIISGLSSQNLEIISLGILPTHALALQTRMMGAYMGIMITASHNRYSENGIKLFNSHGRLLPVEEERKIEKIFFDIKNSNDFTHTNIIYNEKIDYAKEKYVDFIHDSIKQQSLKEIKILVDCANGAAFSVADDVFKKVSCDYRILNNHPNGKNINDNCGSLYPNNLCNEVINNGADLGICLDGDADRVILIDECGKVIDGDLLLAFLARYYRSENQDNRTIVITEYSNLALDEYLKKFNISVIRVSNGERNVVSAMDETNSYLGGEYTGHIILRQLSSAGDGLLIAIQVMNILVQNKLRASSINNLFNLNPSTLVSIPVREKVPFEDIDEIRESIAHTNYELKDIGRLIIRYSGTESVCRIMIEAKDQKKIDSLIKELSQVIKKHLSI